MDTPDDAPAPVPAPESETSGLDAHALVELVATCQARIAALHAVQAGAIGALLSTPEFTLPPAPDTAPGPGRRGEPLVDDLVAELAARLTLTTSAAGTLVSTADRLTRALPTTLDALATGRTDWARARIVAEATSLLTDDQARYIDHQITTDLTTCTTGALRARLEKHLHRLDPDLVRRRARRAVADRCVRYYPVGDGIAELLLRGPATDLRCAYEHLTSLAKDTTRPGARTDPHADTVDGPHTPDPDAPDTPVRDRRGLDAKRFDAAITQLTAPDPGAPGIGAGRGPQLLVHLSTALGLDESSGELVGHGPIPAAHVRALLRWHRFRRVLTDPVTGAVTAVDGHSCPAGTLPDLSRPAPAATSDDPDPGAAHGAGSRGADEATSATRSPDEPRRAHPACPVEAAGSGSYTIPIGTERLVKTRSPRCTAPGCRVPATRCDTDHVRPWPQGPTCACNLTPLCRRHHDLKTRRRWRLRKATDDPRDPAVTWTTTLGHSYTVIPEPLLSDPDPSRPPPPAAPPPSDHITRYYDRGYPTGPPEPEPDSRRDGSRRAPPPPSADPPRRTWDDLPDDPPY